MVMIKRTGYNDGVKYIIYLSYVDGILIDEKRVDNAERYQVLNILAPTGKDILIKERVYYSDDDYQESQKIVKYQVGNIHRNSIVDIAPTVVSINGSNIKSSYKDTLSLEYGKVNLVLNYTSGINVNARDSLGELELPHDTGLYSALGWADVDYGVSDITHLEIDPINNTIFTGHDAIPASAMAGEDLVLPYSFPPFAICEVRTIDNKLLVTRTPIGVTVTIPGKYFKSGHKLILVIIKNGYTLMSRVITIEDRLERGGEIPTGTVSLYKMIDELKTLPDSNMDPLDREFYRETDGDVDPHNMTKLRLDGYETYDDIIYSVEDECLYRYNGMNMYPIPIASFTTFRLPEDTRFIYRRSDGTYLVASKTRVGLYNSTFGRIRYFNKVVRYSTGGFFFSRDAVIRATGTDFGITPLPPELITYIPTYTQYGFIHFIATNETPDDLPRHMGLKLSTLTLLPLGDPHHSINLLKGRTVTHTCMGLDGDPLIIADNHIYKYDVSTNKYSRLFTVPGVVVALYRLDDYIIIKTGNGQHYRLVMDT